MSIRKQIALSSHPLCHASFRISSAGGASWRWPSAPPIATTPASSQATAIDSVEEPPRDRPRACGALMGPDDHRVEHRPPGVLAPRPIGHQVEQLLEPARSDPASEPVVDRVPGTELRRRVAPGDVVAGPVEDGLEELSVGQLRLRPQLRAAAINHRAEDGSDLVADQVSHGGRHPPGRRSALNSYRTGPRNFDTDLNRAPDLADREVRPGTRD